MTEAEGWRWAYTNNTPAKANHFEICFTGFSDSEKGLLSQLAIDAGFMVVGYVTRNLSILCTSQNPSKTKLEKASKQHATTMIMTLEQFLQFLKTGEVPA